MFITLWRHDGGAWQNSLIITTIRNVNSWVWLSIICRTRLHCGKPLILNHYRGLAVGHSSLISGQKNNTCAGVADCWCAQGNVIMVFISCGNEHQMTLYWAHKQFVTNLVLFFRLFTLYWRHQLIVQRWRCVAATHNVIRQLWGEHVKSNVKLLRYWFLFL